MAANPCNLVEAVRDGLISLGAVALLILFIRAWRRRHQRADAEPERPIWPVVGPAPGPSIVHVAALLPVYVLLVQTAAWLVLGRGGLDLASRPGTHEFHLLQACDSAAKLLLAGVMALLLREHAGFRSERARPEFPALIAAGLLGGLIMTSVVEGLLWTSERLFELLRPGLAHPEHPVLLALKNSAWGRWGVLQLVVSTVLIAPLVEELFFRGLLLASLRSCFATLAPPVAISSLAFGLVHAAAQPQAVLPLTAMGVALAWLRLRYASLLPCLLLHAYFNAQTMTIALLCPELVRS